MSAFTEFEAFEPVPVPLIRRDEATFHAALEGLVEWARRFGATYRLTEPLAWEIGCAGSGWVLTIPPGTRFDISVPRALEWALSPHDRRVLPAAAVHDELLRQGHDAAFASAEFRRATIARGVRPWFGWLLFAAVFIWTVMVRPKPADATDHLFDVGGMK